MNATYAYSYVMLRYVHDTTTGEFVNVGVALYAPEARYVGALCRTTIGRFREMFPNVNAEHFRALMRHVQTHFEQSNERLGQQLPLQGETSVMDFARAVLPSDDSALQWSAVGSGRTSDPSAALEKLFERMVMRYEKRTQHERRDDDEVWRHFKKSLETRQLLRHFAPRTVAVKDDELEFKHTWKNGVLHCLEPVSFDLVSPDSIRDKAHRWLGRISSIQSSSERFHMYFLVGEPRDSALADAYENALSILGKVPVEKNIVREADAEKFVQALAMQVEEHEAAVLH